MHLPDRCKELPQAAPRQVLAAATLAPASATLAPAGRAARSRGSAVITLWFQSVIRASFKMFFWGMNWRLCYKFWSIVTVDPSVSVSYLGYCCGDPVCIALPGRDVHPGMYPHRHWNMAVLRCQGTPFPKSYFQPRRRMCWLGPNTDHRGWVRPELVLGGGEAGRSKWSEVEDHRYPLRSHAGGQEEPHWTFLESQLGDIRTKEMHSKAALAPITFFILFV